ncbi:hypothetical protein HanXRQr2_Chr03g0111661 [Helianthus annuus]|uniref:Uncharacterized protein n=1 Tax=Helianthus annuus TaxID=4232 RepID=A0A9K3NX06_HELAN|nr:hypothetical protein HanXRQr2_Chr03g0111661 [Helianthus annuus]KAJ0943730.1 hypothetical protein HanPSC8_Chr03g0108081 [Helianthus annuus]
MIISLTPNELGGGLGKEAGQTNQERRKSTIRMQEINIGWICTSLSLSGY